MSSLTQEQIIEALSQAGYRITQSRRAVIRVLLEDNGFASPPEIWERAMEDYPGIGRVTVYRTLDLLSRLGFVRRIHTEEGCHGRASIRLGHHHHLICRQCGAAVEFEGCDLSSFLARVSGETGYLIEEHMLELVGLCPECR
jgi:Fur family transcriptional regulator, ferric uptake regulator